VNIAVPAQPRKPRIAVALTGATGAVFGIRMLERLSTMDVETHLIISRWGRRTIEHETELSVKQVRDLADVSHPIGDQAATLSSGSFRTDALVVAPCSVRTLAAIAHGLADNLITRTADVVLKERKTLLLLVREAPLNDIHLQNMLTASRAGAVIFPPVPAFYMQPSSLDDVVDHIVTRGLDQLGFESDGRWRWDGHLRHRHKHDETVPPASAISPEGGRGGLDRNE
jgi:flavin prenyltransferase